jgi:putative transposase
MADPTGRNLLMHLDDTGRDSGSSSTIATPSSATFDAVFPCNGIQIIRTLVRAPRANAIATAIAIAERFVGTIRRELLDRILIINQRHATAVLCQYELHYNDRRPHRALGQAAPLRPLPQCTTTEIHNVLRRDRLGGLLHEYQQVA